MPERSNTLSRTGTQSRPVDVSIVVPALNEEITVGSLSIGVRRGLERAGGPWQILIVDSSTDGPRNRPRPWRGSFGRRNEGWVAPILMRPVTFADNGSLWVTLT